MRSRRRRTAQFATLALLAGLLAAPASGWEVLGSDDWLPGDAVNFQAGFQVGEVAAVRMVPTGVCNPCRIDRILFFLGGSTATETVTLRIWDDPTGADAPGTELYSGSYVLTGSNEVVQQVDLASLDLLVTGPFRVGIEFQHAGLPGVATDLAGPTGGRNFIDASGPGWVQSGTLGATGDFVLRAVLDENPSFPLANDSFVSGQVAAFQAGFVPGETAAARFVPVGPCPCRVEKLQFLFGGAPGSQPVVVNIWDDTPGTLAPGALLYTTTLQFTGTDLLLQELDLRALGLTVTGPFRVGFEFGHAGAPSVARDADGIQPGVNLIDESTLGWVDAGTLGVSGDWIIRAVVDEADDILQANDTWLSGQSVGYQGGFVAGEGASVRLTPPPECPCEIESVRFLFGGAPGTHSVTLRIWDDSAGTPLPGAELYSNTYDIAGTDDFLQEIDLAVEGISVSAPYRVGLEFSHSGFPSVARDDDGIHPGQNFIDSTIGWFDATIFGVAGDWIIRAVLTDPVVTPLANDAWVSDASQSFQAGFGAGESGAVRLVPPGPCPCRVEDVSFLFGGASDVESVQLRIWDDGAGTAAPGPLLYTSLFQVAGNDTELQTLDLQAIDLTVLGPFRVGIQFAHAGFPSIARDGDGIGTGQNFVDDSSLGWTAAELLGVTGDWVIRATVTQGLPPAVPSLSPGGMGLLVLGMVFAVAHRGRRRPAAPTPAPSR